MRNPKCAFRHDRRRKPGVVLSNSSLVHAGRIELPGHRRSNILRRQFGLRWHRHHGRRCSRWFVTQNFAIENLQSARVQAISPAQTVSSVSSPMFATRKGRAAFGALGVQAVMKVADTDLLVSAWKA